MGSSSVALFGLVMASAMSVAQESPPISTEAAPDDAAAATTPAAKAPELTPEDKAEGSAQGL
jgi:hypothetical protein